MNILFLENARYELDDSFDWYEQQLSGLGSEFLDEIDKAIRRIKAFPESSETIENDLRRCMLNRFPYAIIYGIDQHTIIIVAIAHLHREPGYWHDR